MKQRYLVFLLAAISSLLLFSCRDRGFKYMREGEIFFNIKYAKNPSTLPVELMPKELIISFKNNKVCSDLRTPFGNSGISTLIDPKEEVFDTYVNLLSMKLYHEGTEKEMQPGFSSMKIISIHETGNEKDILGYKCKEAEVHTANSDSTRYIWYTSEIDVDDPNMNTPYSDVKGVLMEFFYLIGEADIEFTAVSVFAREIPEKNFLRKENYKKVSAGYLDSLIVKMISY